MSPLVEVPINPIDTLRHRQALAAHCDEIFQQMFDGRVATPEEKLLWVEQTALRSIPLRVFENDTYIVDVFREGEFFHLDIRRHDGQTCKEWSDIQQIKNQVVGPEHEATELFPAESRLVDTANQYHLWVHADPTFRFPWGWNRRCVIKPKEQRSTMRDNYPCDSSAATPSVRQVGNC